MTARPRALENLDTQKADAALSAGKLVAIACAFASALALYYLAKSLFSDGDYLGPDNDDAMRLVIVRDFLGGQGWFDHMQYRLGLEPGTLMHWSRLVTLPIALLIRAAHLLTSERQTAEAIALFIWPVGLLFPLICFATLAGNRLGGRQTAVISAFFALSHAFTTGRFAPGAIDHHNVQMVLIAALAASLLDPQYRWTSGLFAGLAASLALAIGAETTPLIAVAGAATALRWAMTGRETAELTGAFGLAFAGFSLLLYGVTTPGAFYFKSVCDEFSAGFLYLACLGGLGLTTSVLLLTSRSMPARFMALLALGVAASILAFLTMPECIGNPYSSLDPLLADIWLGTVSEARSVSSQLALDPSVAGGHYFVGLLAIVVCVIRAIRGEKRQSHILLGLMITAAWAITLVQLRGSMFANLLAIFPLALAISDLRNATKKDEAGNFASIAFAVVTIASLPAFWFAAGNALLGAESSSDSSAGADAVSSCRDEQNFKALARLPEGTIAAVSNYGSSILRYTDHRVLSAPYHRDQAGMLAVLKAGMEKPGQAQAELLSAGADYLVTCAGDSKIRQLAERAPDGLFADLEKGQRPEGYEELKGDWNSAFHVFKLGKD